MEETAHTRDSRTLAEVLARAGYRLTPQRQAIYELIRARDDHPSAETLYRDLRERFPMVSLATIYNTLELFVRLGLVTELGFATQARRYDGNPQPHANLLCIRCGEIVDLCDQALDDLARGVAERSGFPRLGSRYEFHGLCPACRSAPANLEEASPS
ncbi:MAG TPA: Fur family transcriptional regulator [Limnochordia bacterium]